VKRAAIISLAAASALAGGAFAPLNLAQAGMFDMMNPGSWFGDDDDRYYRHGRSGYPPYGYQGGPYGYGPYGYGPYGYGGYSPYGWGGYPGYGPGSTIVVTPRSGDSGEKSQPRLPE
jgi:hypothetical protein